MLFRGFDDEFYVPQSRNTTVDEEDIDNTPGITVLSTSEEGGVFCALSQIMIDRFSLPGTLSMIGIHSLRSM